LKLLRIWFISLLSCTFLLPTESGLANNTIWALPELKTFEFSPSEIDLTSENTSLKVTIVVTHPIGITSEKVKVHLKKGSNFDYAFDLFRTDKPINFSLTEVKFEGIIKLANFSHGVWNLSADPLEGFPPIGSSLRPVSGEFTPKNFRNFIDAENSLLIRLNGFLDFDFTTFVGPTFSADTTITDNKPRNLKSKNPIWRVGETFNPNDYFELRSQSVQLMVESKSPIVCKVENNILKLLAQGECYYRVFTSKTNNFLAKEINLSATVLSARVKPELVLPTIQTLSIADLPKTVKETGVYFQGYPLPPENKTPSVCIANRESITIYSGGICKIEYVVEESERNLASDVYQQTFEILRDPQTIIFTLPSTANVSTRSISLAATSSSGGAITYSTTSAGICSITGSTLNLLKSGNCAITATQAGSSILAPISATAIVMIAGSVAKKTITCVKGNKTRKVSGTNPKCPKGYKVKR
jgi:hypothetical protein